MAKKATKRTRITFGDESNTVEINVFGNSGAMIYSGFGPHYDKNKKAERRNRKIEENRARMYRAD